MDCQLCGCRWDDQNGPVSGSNRLVGHTPYHPSLDSTSAVGCHHNDAVLNHRPFVNDLDGQVSNFYFSTSFHTQFE